MTLFYSMSLLGFVQSQSRKNKIILKYYMGKKKRDKAIDGQRGKPSRGKLLERDLTKDFGPNPISHRKLRKSPVLL